MRIEQRNNQQVETGERTTEEEVQQEAESIDIDKLLRDERLAWQREHPKPWYL